MDNKKKVTGMQAGVQIVSALVWATVIIGCSSALQGTDRYAQIFNILVGGAAAHLLLLSSAFARLFPEIKKTDRG